MVTTKLVNALEEKAVKIANNQNYSQKETTNQ